MKTSEGQELFDWFMRLPAEHEIFCEYCGVYSKRNVQEAFNSFANGRLGMQKAKLYKAFWEEYSNLAELLRRKRTYDEGGYDGSKGV
jgi:ribosomal protein L44E